MTDGTMRLYLIGPMSGIKSFNYPAFEVAASFLRGEGFAVQSPTSLDTPEVFAMAMASPDGDIERFRELTGMTYEDFVSKSVARILTSKPDALVALDGWEESTGAVNEYRIGKAWDIPTFPLDSYDPILGFPVEHNGVAVYDAEGHWINHSDNSERQRSITGGVKDNRGKPLLDLIPYEALLGAAVVLEYGATKYKPNNWRLGLSWSQTWSSLQRHLWAWKSGEELDPETGFSHLAHAQCQMMFLATYARGGYEQFDDRWTSADQEAAKA